ncbi:sigma-70 region 4 domain-containing protein [Nocardia abscessus]|uniref:sigma-70 region 4 domain-containing protein n=1 Tax=Nocardia abscessus TaxID=120957 RepID=UPI0024548839|nr:sigma-70 region 4 domain-containing protein [Nocardia abscessus]
MTTNPTVHIPDPMHKDTTAGAHDSDRPVRTWPVLLLALPAFVAIWSGWVGLGELTGFGPVHPLPGIADDFSLNTAITLPIGMETYASYALYVWLSGRIHADRTRAYAKWSAFGSLALGAVGQVAYHLMEAAQITAAPWPVTVLVACLPVVVLGMGAALAHMIAREHHTHASMRTPADEPADDLVPAEDSDPVHAVSVRADQPEPDSADHTDTTVPALMDRWETAAHHVCAADPNGRRDPERVAAILRLRHEHGWSRARIAEHVGVSASTVTRTLTAAQAHTDHEN